MKKFRLVVIGYTKNGLDSFSFKIKAENEAKARMNEEAQKEINHRVKIGMWLSGEIDNVIAI